MRYIANALIGMGSAAILFIIVWTMVLGSWILWGVIINNADISAVEGGIITAFLALPYTFAKLINDRFPRKEKSDAGDIPK